MKKGVFTKILTLAAIVAFTAIAAVGGTLAYLTDRDSKANTFTVGDVSIKLNEKFEQGAELLPGVKIEKEATVTNTGKNDAWVWMTVAVPEVLDNADASKNVLHWNIPGAFWKGYHTNQTYIDKAIANGYLPEGSKAVAEEDTWTVMDEVSTMEVDGVNYTVYTLLYNGVVESNETTNIGISEVYMDTHVDIHPDGGMYWVEDGTATELNWNVTEEGNPVIYVSAYAIQEEGFTTVEDAYAAYNEQWGDNGAEYAEPEALPSVVNVSPNDFDSVDWNVDNATYKLSGDFNEPLTINVKDGLTQTFDATGANFVDETTVTINAPGVAHAYSSLAEAREGVVTVKGFEVETLNVLAYNNETVKIVDNKVNSMSVIGGNFELVIDGNLIDGNFGAYKDGEDQTNEYGISLRITDYELSITNNTITDVYSHAIGINGRQGEVSSDWGACGKNNKIVRFTGNNITVNSTEKTERAAFKIWCDQVYAPYATSGQKPNDAAKALMGDILADTTNTFTLGQGHTIFNIFDYKTSDGQ